MIESGLFISRDSSAVITLSMILLFLLLLLGMIAIMLLRQCGWTYLLSPMPMYWWAKWDRIVRAQPHNGIPMKTFTVDISQRMRNVHNTIKLGNCWEKVPSWGLLLFVYVEIYWRRFPFERWWVGFQLPRDWMELFVVITTRFDELSSCFVSLLTLFLTI